MSTGISILSPSKDIDNIDVFRKGDSQNLNDMPFTLYLSYSDSAYNGPSSSYKVLASSSGWIYGHQPNGDLFYWSFQFYFQGGGSCQTAYA